MANIRSLYRDGFAIQSPLQRCKQVEVSVQMLEVISDILVKAEKPFIRFGPRPKFTQRPTYARDGGFEFVVDHCYSKSQLHHFSIGVGLFPEFQ